MLIMIMTGSFYGQEIEKITRKGVVDTIIVENIKGVRGEEIVFDENAREDGKYNARITAGDSVFVLTDEFTAKDECEMNVVFVKVAMNVNGTIVKKKGVILEIVSGAVYLKEGEDKVFTLDEFGDAELVSKAAASKLKWWNVENAEYIMSGMMKLQYNIEDKDSKLIASYADNLGYDIKLSTFTDEKGSVCKNLRVVDYLDLSCGEVTFVKFITGVDDEDDDDFDADFYDDDYDDTEDDDFLSNIEDDTSEVVSVSSGVSGDMEEY